LRRLRLTSPGALLILAVVSISGILVLDTAYLRPYVEKRKTDVARRQVSRVGSVLRKAIGYQSTSLLRSAHAWSESAKAAESLHPDAARIDRDAGWARQALESSGADLLWVCDGAGKVVGSWSRGARPGESTPFSLDQIASAAAALDAKFSDGLLRVRGRTLLVARHEIPADRGPGTPGQFWLGRHVAGPVLSDLATLVGGKNMSFSGRPNFPVGVRSDATGSFGFWPVEESRAVIAGGWMLHDAGGGKLGYLKADLPAGELYRMTGTVRRTVLVLVSMALALVLLVILATQMLISGPVVRLLKRLQDLNVDEAAANDFSSDLRGEPLVLARRLESAFDKLAQISKTDELTELANRRHFLEVLECFYRQARRYNRPLSVMVMDVDFFKAVNDTGGHHMGDEFLVAVAQSIEQACRKADLPARIGGDEFGVVLPETGSDAAAAVAERIRLTVAAQTMSVKSVEVNATVSVGICDLNAGEIHSAQAMVALADEALYRAKQLGRNRVIQAGELPGVGWQEANRPDTKVGALCSRLAGLDTQFQGLFLQAIEEIVEMLERRDPHMAEHARKVQRTSVLIAREMGLPERIIKRLETASMLHDIGMLAMPDTVLLCPRELDDEQMQLMRRHTLLGVQIMERMEFLEQEIPAVRYHHERYDGKGYPEGLAGASIPLTARILAVADAFVAMTSPRTYRNTRDSAQALVELRAGAGRQFDPGVIEAFVAVAERLGDTLLAPTGGAPTSLATRDTSVANEPTSVRRGAPTAQPD